MLLLRNDKTKNIAASTCINTLPANDTIVINSMQQFNCRPVTDNVRINMVNTLKSVHPGTNVATNGQECEWSAPVITNMIDAPARTCAASLEDGRIYYLGNPMYKNRDVLAMD